MSSTRSVFATNGLFCFRKKYSCFIEAFATIEQKSYYKRNVFCYIEAFAGFVRELDICYNNANFLLHTNRFLLRKHLRDLLSAGGHVSAREPGRWETLIIRGTLSIAP